MPLRLGDRLLEGDPTTREPHPVGVVQCCRTAECVGEPVAVPEVQRRHRQTLVEVNRGPAGEGLHRLPESQQPLRNVLTRIIERSRDDAEFRHTAFILLASA